MPFEPRFEVLPASQQKLWPDLAPVKDLGFTLYGGTAIALRRGHRTSVDFDFFSDRPLDKQALVAALPALEGPGAEVLQESANTFVALVQPPLDRPLLGPVAADEFGDGRVKVSFFGDLTIGRVGDPELTSDGALLVAHPRDLMATKLKTLFQRIELKDYVDIHELLQHGQSLTRGLADAAALWPGFPPGDCLGALGYHQSPQLHALSGAQKATLNAKIGLAQQELSKMKQFTPAPKKSGQLGLDDAAMARERQAALSPNNGRDAWSR
ncbi:nucleotidyl transferase AbiEii/AbiGii toxin family protein [Burkholderia vietnamiensis]|uniref:Nucleotidyl transferase AbiEii toxin, Type IV TA system n=1 Tax=Burkholderia vietnamiensis (strain G4 / LMG 22486) TaxID=269482 RepID=A4JFW1_BURVG|nr:hypothetical protein Bcep1808_2162 [Burkholderia vietnamiensis G4]MCB4344918.1 nucleotidyl transferase AbiEii/AbiGii toxin family protein [Burkholderia vietnamiensis]